MIKNVGVIGCGTMGSGIGQVAATAGCQVVLIDSNEDAIANAKASIEKILTRSIEKGRIDATEKARIQANITYKNSLSDLSDCDLVIEAIIEDLDIKKQVFSGLEKFVSKDCIIASNTSSLSIASIAASLEHSERCIGIHFFNPAPIMRLVEVIPAIQTEESIVKQIETTITDWGKTVAIAKDTPGFIVNRVARPFYSEALRMLEEGVANIATIDWAMKTHGGFRMGPFELMDFIGNDVNYIVTETVFTAFYFDPRYKPSFTQKRLSEAGYLGRKTGRGYYNYNKPEQNPVADKIDDLGHKIVNRIVVMLINEAADALFLNVASANDIDNAMSKGVNYPKGLLQWADDLGIEACVAALDRLYAEYHEDRYRCSALLRRMAREHKTFY